MKERHYKGYPISDKSERLA